jgi:exopolyphosphatase/guanosine-5'-triphosphate,3'-diphosphate pyrophosphatase
MPGVRLGVVDLGSNSLKHAVADVTAEGVVIVDEGERLVRVSEGLERNGRLDPEAVARTLGGLEEVRETFAEHGVTRERCVATAGLRGAIDAQVVLDGASALGFEIEIISGDQEAALTFAAASQRYGTGPIAVFDLGGRSTEVILGTRERIDARVSMPLGSVRLTERFLTEDPPPSAELDAMRAHIREVLEDAPALPPDVPLIGVASTPMSLFGHAHDIAFKWELRERAEGSRLTILELTTSLAKLAAQTAEDRCLGDVIPPRRADVIVAGAALIVEVLTHYRRIYFTVSGQGVRHGLLTELGGASPPAAPRTPA